MLAHQLGWLVQPVWRELRLASKQPAWKVLLKIGSYDGGVVVVVGQPEKRRKAWVSLLSWMDWLSLARKPNGLASGKKLGNRATPSCVRHRRARSIESEDGPRPVVAGCFSE